jgi:hypothetical protein
MSKERDDEGKARRKQKSNKEKTEKMDVKLKKGRR